MERLMGLVGLLFFMGLALLLSRKRSAIHWRTVFWAMALQWIFALVVLKGTLIQGLLGFLPFPRGTGWVVLLLMFLPMLLRRFADYRNHSLNWTVFGVVVLGLLRGNLVGAAFDRMRLVVEHLMAYGAEGARFVLDRKSVV
jgi:CNT family concentrative nucleoside transporter